jgi:hypothetical protein
MSTIESKERIASIYYYASQKPLIPFQSNAGKKENHNISSNIMTMYKQNVRDDKKKIAASKKADNPYSSD